MWCRWVHTCDCHVRQMQRWDVGCFPVFEVLADSPSHRQQVSEHWSLDIVSCDDCDTSSGTDGEVKSDILVKVKAII